MERRYDLIHAVLLVLFLFVANHIDNAVIKGILLLIFSMILAINNILNLKMKNKNTRSDQYFYGGLLILDCILMVSAALVIISTLIGT
jgi:hypothetical protein